jgi:hypothetical protein
MTPVQITALLAADINVVAAEGVPLEVYATLKNAPALQLSARGKSMALYAGGTGIGPIR